MMTTNLFVIAVVKHLRTSGSFRILLPFFRASLGVGFINSAVFNSFHNGRILEDLRNFFFLGGGGFEPHLQYTTAVMQLMRIISENMHTPYFMD